MTDVATSRKRIVYKPTWTMTTGIGQAYTRRSAQRTSERSRQPSVTPPMTIAYLSKPRHVLETFLDEIDFQMDEETVEYNAGVRN